MNIELSGDAVPPPPPLSKELTLHRRVMLTATGGSSPHIRLRDAEDGPDDISAVGIRQTELKTETMALQRGPSSHEEFLAEKILDLVEDREPVEEDDGVRIGEEDKI